MSFSYLNIELYYSAIENFHTFVKIKFTLPGEPTIKLQVNRKEAPPPTWERSKLNYYYPFPEPYLRCWSININSLVPSPLPKERAWYILQACTQTFEKRRCTTNGQRWLAPPQKLIQSIELCFDFTTIL